MEMTEFPRGLVNLGRLCGHDACGVRYIRAQDLDRTIFTTALERLKKVHENDPLKTGTEEDTFVNAMMIALLLLETSERHLG